MQQNIFDQFNTGIGGGGGGGGGRREKKAVKAYLIKNSRGRGTITSSRKDWAEYYVTVHPM